MIRSVEDKLTTARDTALWLRSIEGHENDEEITCLLRVIEATMNDYIRVISHPNLGNKKLTKTRYAEHSANLAIASALLEDHLTKYRAELVNWTYVDIPHTGIELIATVLNDVVAQLTSALHSGVTSCRVHLYALGTGKHECDPFGNHHSWSSDFIAAPTDTDNAARAAAVSLFKTWHSRPAHKADFDLIGTYRPKAWAAERFDTLPSMVYVFRYTPDDARATQIGATCVNHLDLHAGSDTSWLEKV